MRHAIAGRARRVLALSWVHSSVVRAADRRSAGTWFKSGRALMHAHLEPTASPSTCTHIVLTHPVPPVCGMRSHTSPPACTPARSMFSPDNAHADSPRLDYAVASRAASHVGLCKRIRFVCSVLLWCKYNSMRDFRCLYSSVVERQSCKLKVLGSIPSGGFSFM